MTRNEQIDRISEFAARRPRAFMASVIAANIIVTVTAFVAVNEERMLPQWAWQETRPTIHLVAEEIAAGEVAYRLRKYEEA